MPKSRACVRNLDLGVQTISTSGLFRSRRREYMQSGLIRNGFISNTSEISGFSKQGFFFTNTLLLECVVVL